MSNSATSPASVVVGSQQHLDGWRVRSIDVARGLIMVLMALDHVRVYAGVPAGGADPALFFTRWVTHFCAPGFVFLAGTSAFFQMRKMRDESAFRRSLLIRGLILVVCDLTIMRMSWTFNFDVWNYNVANVLWAIGWSMVALSVLARLPIGAIGVIGGLIAGFHNVVDFFQATLQPIILQSAFAPVGRVLYYGGAFRLWEDGPRLVVLYSLIPWIGVIALGYVFGYVLRERPSAIKKATLLGALAVAAFLVLRTFNIYGDPRPWGPAAPLSFLNATKYPGSLQFLLMTLGPLLLLLPAFERSQRPVFDMLAQLGRVPLFYYVVHIPIIHLVAIAVSLFRTGSVTPWLFTNFPMEPAPQPPGYRWSLALLYLVTAVVVCLLYGLCRWYQKLRARQGVPAQASGLLA